MSFISLVSNPVQYDSGNYYCYVQFNNGLGGVTWDTAKTLVNELSYYNGLAPQLATFPTTAQYDWLVTQEQNFSFTSPEIGEWDIAWIGAGIVSGTTYQWINGGGTIPAGAAQWDTGQPVADNYGVSWNFSGYGDKWVTRLATDGSIGNALVQYTAIPEPATLGLLALAFGTLALRARRVRTAP